MICKTDKLNFSLIGVSKVSKKSKKTTLLMGRPNILLVIEGLGGGMRVVIIYSYPFNYNPRFGNDNRFEVKVF
jgi:hypothetical protein